MNNPDYSVKTPVVVHVRVHAYMHVYMRIYMHVYRGKSKLHTEDSNETKDLRFVFWKIVKIKYK